MAKLTKNRKESLTKFETEKLYSLKEASDVVKNFSKLKFDSSIDLAVNLGVDPKKADQNVRGIVSLPNGTGKDVKVLALVTPDKEDEAKKAGADFVGLDEFLKKIKDGWTDVDVIITMPSVMGKLGPLGKILGPRGLMPNPKTGTVTMNVGKAVEETKAGKIDFKVDKNGTIHVAIGKVSFSSDKIYQNAKEVLDNIVKIKPSSSKGIYMKSIFMSSTMSPGIKIDTNSF
jgi:large subunit ribosomal protein L1|tara:strand:+ start:381 stop:1070 length:690 start_codon:yes stop_codon:yes gene_type:complete